MRHLNEPTLIDRLRGGLAAEAARQIDQHIDACPQCASRMEAMRRLHVALGAWSVQPGSTDLASAVLDRAARRRTDGWRRLLPIGRAAAAAVLVGALAGWAVGRSRVSPAMQVIPATPTDPAARVDAEYALSTAPIGLNDVLIAMAFEQQEPQP